MYLIQEYQSLIATASFGDREVPTAPIPELCVLSVGSASRVTGSRHTSGQYTGYTKSCRLDALVTCLHENILMAVPVAPRGAC